MDFLKLVFSEGALKGLAAFAFVAMILSVRYWIDLYNQFSLDILTLALPVDLLGLSISKLPLAISALVVAAAPIGAVFLMVWSDSRSSSTATGCIAIIGFLCLAFLPGASLGWAARTDAQVIRTAVQPGWFARHLLEPKPPIDAAIETKDGAQPERARWIGATSTYVFLLRQDSTVRTVRREDIKSMTFSTIAFKSLRP